MGAFTGLDCEQSSSFQFIYLFFNLFLLPSLPLLVHAFPALTSIIMEGQFFPISPSVLIYYYQKNETTTLCLKQVAILGPVPFLRY